jgi:hypothetical protein
MATEFSAERDGRGHGVRSSGLRVRADAIRERIGSDASYSSFTPPSVRAAERRGRRWERRLWAASLALLVVVLVLALLVALGY